MNKGTVTRVSKYGLQLNNEGTWYNWANDYDHPHVEKGQSVSLETNEKGYVYKLDLLTDNAPEAASLSGSAFRSPLHIVRQGALEAAVAFCRSGESDGGVDVIKVATQYEEWILRE